MRAAYSAYVNLIITSHKYDSSSHNSMQNTTAGLCNNGFDFLRNSAATKEHNTRLMDGKLNATLPPNEKRSTTLCIIFMLMCTTRQLFSPYRENTSIPRVIVLLVAL